MTRIDERLSERAAVRRRVLLAVGAVALVAALIAACSSGGAQRLMGGNAPPAASAGAADAAALAPADKTSGAATTAYSADRQIVKTGDVTLEVANVANALAEVRTLAVELGGYVGGSQAGTLSDAATLTLRIPANRFDDALARLHALKGKVVAESTQEQDVTSAVVDLDARIKNLQASEASYRALLAKAQKIEDILAVQSHLDDVQGQIEQLSAQLKQLSNQADLATLTVTLQPQAEPIQAASTGWDPGTTLQQAVGALLQVGQAVVTGAIWLGIVGFPLLVVLGVGSIVVARLIPQARRRGPAPTADPPAAA
jgi:Domain of unknown function (DUF4349)